MVVAEVVDRPDRVAAVHDAQGRVFTAAGVVERDRAAGKTLTGRHAGHVRLDVQIGDRGGRSRSCSRGRYCDQAHVVRPGVATRPHPIRHAGGRDEFPVVAHAVERLRVVEARQITADVESKVLVGRHVLKHTLHREVERIDEIVPRARGRRNVRRHLGRQLRAGNRKRHGRHHRVAPRRGVLHARRRHRRLCRQHAAQAHNHLRPVVYVAGNVADHRAVQRDCGREVLLRANRLREGQHGLRAALPRGDGKKRGRRRVRRIVHHVDTHLDGRVGWVGFRPVTLVGCRIVADTAMHHPAGPVVEREKRTPSLVVVHLHRPIVTATDFVIEVVGAVGGARQPQTMLLAVRIGPELDVALVHQLPVAVGDRLVVAPDAEVRHLLLEKGARAARRHADLYHVVRERVQRHPHPVVHAVRPHRLKPVGDA